MTTTTDTVATWIADEIDDLKFYLQQTAERVINERTGIDAFAAKQVVRFSAMLDTLQLVQSAFAEIDEDFGADPVYALLRKMAKLVEQMERVLGGDESDVARRQQLASVALQLMASRSPRATT